MACGANAFRLFLSADWTRVFPRQPMNDLVWGVSDPSCISAPSMHSTDYFLEGPVDVVNILAERAISWRTS